MPHDELRTLNHDDARCTALRELQFDLTQWQAQPAEKPFRSSSPASALLLSRLLEESGGLLFFNVLYSIVERAVLAEGGKL